MPRDHFRDGGWRDLALLALLVALLAGASTWNWAIDATEKAWRGSDAQLRLAGQQVDEWFQQRIAIAALVGDAEPLAELYQRGWNDGDAQARDVLTRRLSALANVAGFTTSLLHGPNGALLWTGGAPRPGLTRSSVPPSHTPGGAAGSAVVRTDLVQTGSGDTFVELTTELPLPDDQGAPVVRYYLPLATAPIAEVLTLAGVVVPTHLYLMNLAGDGAVGIVADGNDVRAARWSAVDISTLPLRAEEGPIVRIQRVRGPDGIAGRWAARPLATTDWWLVGVLPRTELARRVLRPVVVESTVWAVVAYLVFGLAIVVLRQQRRTAWQRARVELATERQRALDLLDAIAQASNDAIYAKTLDGHYLFVNRAAAEVIGATQEQLIGTADTEAFPERADELRANEQRVISQDRILTFDEAVGPPGAVRHFEATTGPLRDQDGRLLGVFGISRDVTQLREAQRGLERQRAELERTVSELERFNAVMVDRELRMIELKREVNQALARLGEPLHYETPEANTDLAEDRGDDGERAGGDG